MTPTDGGEWGRRLLVVGTGLIGTSVALAVRATGGEVFLADADSGRLATAVAAGAGRGHRPGQDGAVDLVVVAVPPARVGQVILDQLRLMPDAIVTHVSSIQTLPQREVEAQGGLIDRFVGSHPIAGRELSGPAHASPDLFVERPWVVTPTAASAARAVDAVVALARACGARPAILDAVAHDALFARLSHVPQLVASALAASIAALSGDDAALAGTGLRDTTRLADSDPALWAEIITANAAPVAAGLRAVAGPLVRLAADLENGADPGSAVHALLEQGRAGRALLPGKHGGAPVEVQLVQVVVPDQPGTLARLLGDVAAESVNLEDLRVEHAPGQPLGIAEISVLPAAYDQLVDALQRRGWTVTS
ncbi:MAG TPA: prephenate dehydrogenase [Mycobacteriales bacterium]|nr:prephenate dehydrogenase [Mycobacteriales bacterium]